MNLNDVSVFVAQWGGKPPKPAELIAVAKHAEELGFYSIGIPHVPLLPHADERPGGSVYQTIPAEYRDYQYDALVLVPMIMQATHRIRVGFNVLVAPWVHPFVWAKYMASLDAAGGGRLIAGFGLGYAPPKGPTKALDNLGISGHKRGAMSDEALQMIVELWTSHRPVSFEGQFYRGVDLVVEPKPVQQPYPELWWAGEAAASIARAAKYADFLELNWPLPDSVEQRRDALRTENAKVNGRARLAALMYAQVLGHEMSVGRLAEEYQHLVHSESKLGSVIAGTPERCAELLHVYREAGVTHFALDFNRHGQDTLATVHAQLDLFATKVAPLL